MSLERVVRGTTVPKVYNLNGAALGVPGVGTQAEVYADMVFQADGTSYVKPMDVLEALGVGGAVTNKGMVSGSLGDDTAMTAGLYRVRFRVMYPDGSIDYFPSDEPLSVLVMPEPVVTVVYPHPVGKSLAQPYAVRKAVGSSRALPYTVTVGAVVIATLDFGGGNGLIVTADASWLDWIVFIASGSGPSQPYVAELDSLNRIANSHSAMNGSNQMVTTSAQHAAGLRALVPGWAVQVVGDPNFVPGETPGQFVGGSGSLDGGLPSGGQTDTQDGGLHSGGQTTTIDGGTP